MESMRLVLVIAIIAGWMSLNGLLCIAYLWLTGRLPGHRQRSSKRRDESPDDNVEAPVLIDEKAGAWGLFVMFDTPDMGLNQRVGGLLATAGAVHESRSKTFTLAGESPRNPILIANAYPPGTLPSFNQDNGPAPIKGISLKMAKKNRSATPNKMQLAKLVSLTREFIRLGGKAVDADKHPVTEAGLQAVINGRAKV